MSPGCAVDEEVEGHASELFHVTVELAGQPGFQDGDVCPDKGSCHHRDGDARLLAKGGEPVTEVLLGVRRPRASPVIKIASPACDAQPNERCASDWYPSGRLRTFASKFHPERAAAAASARV